jgi:hypothetical protein
MNKLASDAKLTLAQRKNIARYGFITASSVPSLGLNKDEVVKRASAFNAVIEKAAARHTRLVEMLREHVLAPA